MPKIRKVADYHSNGIKKSEGFINIANRKPIGRWEYFNEFGRITSRGSYNSSGQKEGAWLNYDWHAGDLYRAKFSRGKAGEIVFLKKITKILPKNLPDAIHEILHLSAANR